MAKKTGSKVQATCPICGKVMTKAGLIGHMAWKHGKQRDAPMLPSKAMPRIDEKQKAELYDTFRLSPCCHVELNEAMKPELKKLASQKLKGAAFAICPRCNKTYYSPAFIRIFAKPGDTIWHELTPELNASLSELANEMPDEMPDASLSERREYGFRCEICKTQVDLMLAFQGHIFCAKCFSERHNKELRQLVSYWFNYLNVADKK